MRNQSAYIFKEICIAMLVPDASGTTCRLEGTDVLMTVEVGPTAAALLLEGIAVVKDQPIEWTMTCQGTLLSLWPKKWET